MSFPTQQQIADFKRQIASSKRIDEVVDYFFDHFAGNAEFQNAGHALSEIPDTLQEAVVNVIGNLFSKTVFRLSWILVDVPPANLMHGSLTVDDKPGMVLWAPDIMVGVVAIAVNPKSGKTSFARITVTEAVAAKAAN